MTTLKSRLFVKIMVSYVILLVAILLCVDIFMARRLHQNYIQQEQQRLESLTRLLGLEAQGLSRDSFQPWALRRGETLSCRLTLIDASGRVLADNQSIPEQMNNHSNRPEIQQAMTSELGSSIRYSHTLKKNELYVACRFAHPTFSALIVRLALPLQEIAEGFRPTQRELLLISFFPLILAILLGYFYTRSLMTRIEKIRDFSEDISRGELSARIRGTTHDELGSLAESLNTTANSMQQAIQELQQEKNRSNAILEGMQAGVLAVDAGGRITLINPALSRMLGLPAADSLGRRVLEVLRNAELKQVIDKVLLEHKEQTATIEVQLNRRRTFAVVAVPLPEAQSERSGVVAVLHDVTRLIELENIRKDFVANLSHELRTPLTSIQGFAETLLEGALEDKKDNRRFVEIIRNHAFRLSTLTDDLLTLASMESDQIRLKLEPVDWKGLLEEAVESTRPLRTQKHQQVRVEVASELPAVQADREKIRQVLLNLLDNAYKFTPEGGNIRVEISHTSGETTLEVHVVDDGVGIPSQDLPRIFERFYRVDKARSRELGGTGLGLAIVKHIVEAHQGKVGVKSQLGQGSDFWFQLPVTV